MPLETIRHFRFVKDPLTFEQKKSAIVWRGAVYKPHRLAFVHATHTKPFCNVGAVAKKADYDIPVLKKMSVREQLNYRFIFSVEGNDVATNLKWIMSSNSVCFMTRPRCETWFMEGWLKDGVHYVELADDYSDLEEKFHYYDQRPDVCAEIISNAKTHVHTFFDVERELLLAEHVISRYLSLSGQAAIARHP